MLILKNRAGSAEFLGRSVITASLGKKEYVLYDCQRNKWQ